MVTTIPGGLPTSLVLLLLAAWLRAAHSAPHWERLCGSGSGSPACGTPPIERYGSAVAVVPSSGAVLAYGGRSPRSLRETSYEDLWELSKAAPGASTWHWQKLCPGDKCEGTVPPKRYGHTMTDLGDGKWLVFGGFELGVGYLNDAWLLERTSSGARWLPFNATGTFPYPRAKHTTNRLPGNETGTTQLVVYGGFANDLTYGDVWRVVIGADGAPAHWQLLCETAMRKGPTCKGYLPRARADHSAVVLNGKVLVYGGQVPSQSIYDDVFTLTISAEGIAEWARLCDGTSCGLAPPNRAGHVAVAVDVLGMLVFGGVGFKQQYLADVWLLNATANATFTWAKLPLPEGTGNAPTARLAAAGVWHASLGGMLVFSGELVYNEASYTYNDVWVLHVVDPPPTPPTPTPPTPPTTPTTPTTPTRRSRRCWLCTTLAVITTLLLSYVVAQVAYNHFVRKAPLSLATLVPRGVALPTFLRRPYTLLRMADVP